MLYRAVEGGETEKLEKAASNGGVPSVWFSSLDFVGRQEQQTTPF